MEISISPIELKDYLVAKNWVIVKEAFHKDHLFVLNNTELERQVYFSALGEGNTSENQISETIYKLSKIYNTNEQDLIAEIKAANEDLLKIRFIDNKRNIDSLTFESAINAIDGAKKLLISAANNTLEPKTYYSGKYKNKINDFIKQARFRHTERGSFILNISTPLTFENTVPQLFNQTIKDELPIERQIFTNVNYALDAVYNNFNLGTEQEFAAEQLNDSNPIISYNFLDAVNTLFENGEELPIELSFKWSIVAKAKIGSPNISNRYLFPLSYKKKIEVLKSYFKPSVKEVENTMFLGSVLSLAGEDNNGREGWVTLKLFHENFDEDLNNVRAYLNKEMHTKAISAYGKPNCYIKIAGKLSLDGRGKKIEEVSLFEEV